MIWNAFCLLTWWEILIAYVAAGLLVVAFNYGAHRHDAEDEARAWAEMQRRAPR